ncbi:MAG: DUF1828 domain-containing protein [Burkholderiales bacterium]|nr:DUF1828 domain-containing protein [Burkholderiales bacterium]
MKAEELEEVLCKSLCAQAQVRASEQGLWQVRTPFSYPDGDAYSLYVRQLPTGGLRITDVGLTLMHLSYDNDVDKVRDGTRGRLLQQILAESDLSEADGEFFIDGPADQLGLNVFRFGQALTRVHDLTFLNRVRAESTFYEDLRELLRELVGQERLRESYVVPDVPRGNEYPVDFFVSGSETPLYLFGVPNRDKARLATIILQHLIAAGRDFNSMIVFQNMAELPRADVSRLTNAANDQVDSLDAADDLRRKLLQRVR